MDYNIPPTFSYKLAVNLFHVFVIVYWTLWCVLLTGICETIGQGRNINGSTGSLPFLNGQLDLMNSPNNNEAFNFQFFAQFLW